MAFTSIQMSEASQTQGNIDKEEFRVDVVLPAGGRLPEAFAQATGVAVKALLRLEGRTLLRRVIGALRATGRVGRIVTVGPEEALREARACGVDGTVAEGATGPENDFRGLEWLRQQVDAARERALILTTDLPFLTPEALVTFLDACPPDADIAIPVVTQQALEARFPGAPHLYTRLRDGAFALGGGALVRPETVLQHRAPVERIFAARKNDWQMARIIGLRTALRFALGRLTMGHIVERASRILNCQGAAVQDAPPELAYDIDRLAEYEHARAWAASGREDVQ